MKSPPLCDARPDAVYLDLHGAMVAEHVDDGEGELLARVRRTVGASVPVVASLDLHANVTQRMLECADALIAYRTYPHVDMAETGARAAFLLGQRLESRGISSPFARVKQALSYAELSGAQEDLQRVAARIAEEGVPAEIHPLVVGFTGYGNVSGGAQEILDILPTRSVARCRSRSEICARDS